MKILLVEPPYKNKYPPMGLMKISTYHKEKGDYVLFFKGLIDQPYDWDRIYITTLFTFDYSKVLKTIKHYLALIQDPDKIYLGGIMASLMTEKLKKETGIKNIISGRLTSAKLLGFSDNTNIDALPLDYDILNDIEYTYATSNSCIAYTSRGCINRCSFCAVPQLEGKLCVTNNISNQINHVRNEYGDKRDLMLLDNNILGIPLKKLEKIVNDLNKLGYRHEKTFKYSSKIDYFLNTYYRYLKHQKPTLPLLIESKEYIRSLSINNRVSQKNRQRLAEILNELEDHHDYFEAFEKNHDELKQICDFYLPKQAYQRYVDFNQGLDAREMTEEKIAILSKLPLKPCRIAFDDIKLKDIYVNAVKLAASYGIKHFSNYILFNSDNDKPEDLYSRLLININLSSEINCATLFSFPMKYAPVDKTDRNYVGKHWNKHYLRSVRAILNVKKGVVAKEKPFFEKAFGKDLNEYFEILSMPHNMIVYRIDCEKAGITQEWKKLFIDLDNNEKSELLDLLSYNIYCSNKKKLNDILKFYQPKSILYNKITKK
ncbi:hypothetical protein [Eubacterium callanderi]|uniref:hypothetical protein n=1 Tax=Eubacterium callanderi TaxID=53442 RepID=UPI001AA0F903|nr:hypothetical protein [Eubacterium callanderi]MBO1703571.1 hypothetical protein [Eubacterium callanderi]